MSAEALSETYLKAKRYLVFFAAILLLSSAVGLSPSDQSNMLGWKVANPHYTSFVLYVVVLYYTSQLALFWDVQGKQIRKLAQHNFDYALSCAIATVAIYSLPLAMALTLLNVEPFAGNTLATRSWAVIWGLTLAPVLCLAGYLLVFRPTLQRSYDAAATREADILSVLTDHVWLLVYNPIAFEQKGGPGSKDIIFLPDGSISRGRNRNEHTWRLNAGYLELLDESGNVFSRFTYDAEKERFINTNDADLQSIRNQYMLKRDRISQLDAA